MKSYLTHVHSQNVESLDFTTAVKLTALKNISLKYSDFGSTCVVDYVVHSEWIRALSSLLY